MLVMYNEQEDDFIIFYYNQDVVLTYNYYSPIFEEWRSFESSHSDINSARNHFKSYGYEVIAEC